MKRSDQDLRDRAITDLYATGRYSLSVLGRLFNLERSGVHHAVLRSRKPSPSISPGPQPPAGNRAEDAA